MTLTAGKKLGPYEVQSPLGAGGMGEVYRARDTRLERTVAVKILPTALASDADRLRRFQHEARVLSALNHANLLTIYDVGNEDGVHYLVSEFLEGQTLLAKLSSGPLPPRKAIDYALQAANGLAAAHDKGIVHRDLKPENLFLTKDGRIKILDFGLAKQSPIPVTAAAATVEAATMTGSPTAAGMVMGTAGYMSPEQVRGESVDHRSDIFAFGAILYEMVSGRRAFRRESSADTMAAILKDDVPETGTDLQIPTGLDRIIHRCLEKSPDQRFQSAKDLSFALENLDTVSSGRLAVGKDRFRFRRRDVIMLTMCLAVVAIAVGTTRWFEPNVVTPKLVPLTNDASAKAIVGWPPPVFFSPIVSDGARLYFTSRSENGAVVSQVAEAGGDVVPIPLSFRNAAVLGISPDRSELLVESFTSEEVEDPEWIVPVLGGSPRRVDDLKAHDIAWSPDKQSFAFASGNSLYALYADGQKKKLYESAGVVIWPRWSPDGRKLRFTVEDPLRVSSALWEANADGSGAHMLLPGWNKPAVECCGEWTPDGRYFVFQSGGILESQIWAIRESWLGSAKPFPVTAGPLSFYSPVPAPDGKNLFVAGTQFRNEVVRLDYRSAQITPIPNIPSAREMQYSRDGQWICYVTSPEGALWRSRVDGSDRMQLTHAPVLVALPQWSPDGKRIAFVAFRVGELARLEIVSVDGGTPEVLLPELRHQGSGSWSPDGQSFVFGRLPWLEGNKPMPVKLARVDLASRQVTELPNSDNLLGPLFSPDGKLIAAVNGEDSSAQLYNLATGKVTPISQESGSGLAWSRDGAYVFANTDSGKLLRYRVKDGQVETVGTLQRMGSGYTGWFEDPGFLTVAPDGASVSVRSVGSSQIYRLQWQWR